jgi:hypothetical protein
MSKKRRRRGSQLTWGLMTVPDMGITWIPRRRWLGSAFGVVETDPMVCRVHGRCGARRAQAAASDRPGEGKGQTVWRSKRRAVISKTSDAKNRIYSHRANRNKSRSKSSLLRHPLFCFPYYTDISQNILALQIIARPCLRKGPRPCIIQYSIVGVVGMRPKCARKILTRVDSNNRRNKEASGHLSFSDGENSVRGAALHSPKSILHGLLLPSVSRPSATASLGCSCLPSSRHSHPITSSSPAIGLETLVGRPRALQGCFL